MNLSESTQLIQCEGKEYTLTVLEAKHPSCTGVFVAGRGGNPGRHLALLRVLTELGCTMVAPHFQMLASAVPTKAELDERVALLETVLGQYANEKTIGVGHSIGGTLLLALAGGQALTHSAQGFGPKKRWKFDRLALLAPPLDFFLHPGALQSVDTPIYLRNGGMDVITPPGKALRFKQQFGQQGQIDFILDEQAGHFSYMDELPPQIEDTQPDRHRFLANLAIDIGHFLTR